MLSRGDQIGYRLLPVPRGRRGGLAPHRDTVTARFDLAAAYLAARSPSRATPAYERTVADSERILGRRLGDDDDAMSLATVLYEASRMNAMVRVLRRALADCEQFLGPDHEMTIIVRENLESVAK